jgi:hypothetical protein
MKSFAMMMVFMMILPLVAFTQTNNAGEEKVVGKVKVVKVLDGDVVVTDTVIAHADPQDTGLINRILQAYGIDTIASGSQKMVKRIVIPSDGGAMTDELLNTMMDGVSKRIVLINGEEVNPEKADSLLAVYGITETMKRDAKQVTIRIERVDKKEVQTLKKAGVGHEATESLVMDDLNVYPNPTAGEVNLSFTLREKGTLTIRVMDPNGKVVFKDRVPRFSGTYNRSIDLVGKASGLYFLTIEQNGKSITRKLIVGQI